jgi:hypothetical protein
MSETSDEESGAAAHEPGHGWRLGRRGLFKAAAAGAAAPVVASAMCGAPAQAGPAAPLGPWQHAIGAPRGADVAVKVGRSQEGRFGLLFKNLPAYQPPDDLLASLARSMTDPRSPGKDPSDGDQWDNPDITAGYTFFGQFVDHDITRDTTPIPQQRTDPHGLKNFDSPMFDLGSVYGRGPAADPQLYDPDEPGYLAVVQHSGLFDLPRAANGGAYLGDPRNDENIIVAQLHVAFLKFHNALMDQGLGFAEAQRQTVWHYQWLIVKEFLPRICGAGLVDMLMRLGSRIPWYRPRSTVRPMIPIEFSVAAYRFGHSMVRPEYEMNDADTGPIFPFPGDSRDDLRGSRPIPSNYRADWSYFFDIPGLPRPDGLNHARLIDTHLAMPLHDLPDSVVPRDPTIPLFTNLAERNLLRGKRLGLPAGQDVARMLLQKPLTNAQLGLTDRRWGGKAPLWFYVLKEAEIQQKGRRLGTTGGMLVAGTLLTLLFLDRTSYVHARPAWQPATVPFTVGDFLLRAGVIRFPAPEPEEPEVGEPEVEEPEVEFDDELEVEEPEAAPAPGTTSGA